MKKNITLFLLTLLPLMASAYDAKIDGIYYDLDASTKQATVTTGKGKKNLYTGTVTIPSVVWYEDVTYSVTSIGDYAFQDCSKLTSVTIPNSVTSIGNYAFYNCSGLTSITIGNSVTSIGEGAFRDCSGLTSIEIPNSVTSIGEGAFSSCSGLTSVHITDIAAWCKISFGNSLSNPLCYAKHFFIDGKEITDLIIPNSVTSIGSYAFYKCSGLTSITIPNSVTSIGSSAFASCSGLKVVSIPDNTVVVGKNAFNGSGVENMTIGAGIETIGSGFLGLDSLVTLTIKGNGVTFIASIVDSEGNSKGVFESLKKDSEGNSKGVFESLKKLTTIELGEGVVAIGDKTFNNCKALRKIKLGGVTSIGESAFTGCYNLSELDLRNVQSIGSYAFSGCSGVKKVMLADGTNDIAPLAFNGCYSLEDVYGSSIEQLSKIYIREGKDNKEQIVNMYINGEKISDVQIPESWKFVSGYAFSKINDLNTVVLPSSIDSIGSAAFYKTNIEKIYSYAAVPPVADNSSYTFNPSFSTAVLFVPYGSKEGYMADRYWSKFSRIVEMPKENDGQPEVVMVAKAGGLRLALSELEATKVTNLVIKGQLNAADIALIRAREGRLSTLDSLDLRDVTFVESDEPYMTYSRVYDGSFMQHTYRFFIGKERKDSTWMGGLSQAGPAVHDHYDYCLPYAFSGVALKRVVLPVSFSEIGYDMFSKCSSLEEVVAPSTLTIIGSEAFYGCKNLTTVPDLSKVTEIGASAFSGCTLLQVLDKNNEIDISSLDSIPDNAFYDCKSIGNVLFSKGLRVIGSDAFNGSGLTKLNLPVIVNSIGERAFANTTLRTVVWPSGTVELSHGVFEDCTNLTKVQLPDNLYRIGGYAFWGCTSLSDIELPAQLCRIGYSAFKKTPWYENIVPVGGIKYAGNVAMESSVSNIVFREGTTGIADGFNGKDGSGYNSTYNSMVDSPVSVTLPASLRYIGKSAFYRAPLSDISIPDNVEEIGDYAFLTCKNITAVKLPSKLKAVGHEAFRNTSIETLTIPETVEEIGNMSFANNTSLLRVEYNVKNTKSELIFSGCTSLERVTIGDRVETIPTGIFRDCTGVLKVNMGKNVTEICDYAFNNCSVLTSITIPNSVTEIGDGAFYGCSSLADVYCYVKEVPTTSSSAFDNKYISNTTLYVPVVSVDAYEATNPWSRFGTIIALSALRGDANGDGEVDMDDAKFVSNVILGTEDATEAADVNNDGKVNMPDAMFIVNKILNGKFPDE